MGGWCRSGREGQGDEPVVANRWNQRCAKLPGSDTGGKASTEPSELRQVVSTSTPVSATISKTMVARIVIAVRLNSPVALVAALGVEAALGSADKVVFSNWG